MNILKKLFIGFLLLNVANVFAQVPTNYYNSVQGLCGEELRQGLSSVISSHTTLGYDELWNAYMQTDVRSDDKVWDMYSDCDFDFDGDKCGSYSSECNCYNREHSMPKSWFNDASPMLTDLFHVYPTDGWVNNKRGNLPFGEVGNPSYTSGNGSKVGSCSYAGYTGTVFEPIDEYKGDFARTYFYMSTCYINKNLGQSNGSAMFEGSQLKSWAVNMLLEWHRNDPVSQKEIDRNNAVYQIQGNRNPFIDCPYFVDAIWTNVCDYDVCLDIDVTKCDETKINFSISPNPANTYIEISAYKQIVSVSIYNVLGENLITKDINSNFANIDVSQFKQSTYFVNVEFDNGYISTQKLLIY